ncbi:MAG: hypothetical protein ACM3N0_10955 [Chloroflexota bacterium]
MNATEIAMFSLESAQVPIFSLEPLLLSAESWRPMGLWAGVKGLAYEEVDQFRPSRLRHFVLRQLDPRLVGMGMTCA